MIINKLLTKKEKPIDAAMETPVLFIVFNRPDTTKVAFAAIRGSKPSRLYIAADGPRAECNDDLKKCLDVRNIVNQVDWPCKIKTLFREENIGCKRATTAAIDWFFENETEGIIIEDDIVPAESFFSYASKMLSQYRDSKEVRAVIGFNHYGQKTKSNSYFFYSGYCFYPWGWATWKRAWQDFNVDNFSLENLKLIAPKTSEEKKLFNLLKLNLKLVKMNILDTWDFVFVYWLLFTKSLVIVPFANQIKNIGVNGVHSRNNILDFQYGILDPDKIYHPSSIEICYEMDKKYFSITRKINQSIILKNILLELRLYKILKNLKKNFTK